MIPTYRLTPKKGDEYFEMDGCPYCHEVLEADDRWWVCHTCGVDFVYSTRTGLHIKFDRTIGNWETALNLYPEDNRTVLTAFSSQYLSGDSSSGNTRVEIPHCMTNITPHNVVDKMKLIMVWQ